MVALIVSFFFLFSPQEKNQAGEQEHHADSVKNTSHKIIHDSTGHFVRVNRIFITGNRITRDRIVLRELTLKPGDVIYSTDLDAILDLDKKKLINTRLFNTAEIKILELEPGKIDLVVDVNERWYTFPAPVFALSDRNFNDWWQNYNHDIKRVNYGVRISQYNFRGRNETLRFHAQFGFQRRFELMYRIPYLDKRQKHGVILDAQYLETKNVAYRTFNHKYEYLKGDHLLRTSRLMGVTYTYRNSFYQSHWLRVEYNYVHIDDTVKFENPLYIKGESQDQRYTSITYQFNSDHRDYFPYPLKGHQFLGSIGRTGILEHDNLKRFELNLSYSRYFDLNKGYFFSSNLVGFWSDKDNVSYVNYGTLGLKKQFVRGYELYVIEGPYYAMNKTTFKKRIFSRKYHWADMPIQQFRHIPLSIYVKTYADIGYVKNYSDYEKLNINTRLADKILSGVGGGFDVVGAYDLVLRFEYTLNAEGEHGFFFHIKREF
jgi:outer membrane protein assembly factor BamA